MRAYSCKGGEGSEDETDLCPLTPAPRLLCLIPSPFYILVVYTVYYAPSVCTVDCSAVHGHKIDQLLACCAITK